MDLQHLQDLQTNDALRRRLAAVIAQSCFRNGKLENFHAGTYPSSEAGDYSDVKVVSPFGDIPWKRLSRLNNAEITEITVNAAERCYSFLSDLFQSAEGDKVIEMLNKQVDDAQTTS